MMKYDTPQTEIIVFDEDTLVVTLTSTGTNLGVTVPGQESGDVNDLFSGN